MNVLVVLKLAVCALCASVYFRYKTPRLFTPLQLILSVMYAFCGYGLLYYQNVMWLDIMYLFPLLLMALDLLLQKGRPALYIVVLALCVTMQFYLSYMTVLCVLLFTAAHFCIYREKVQKKYSRVVLYLLAFVGAFVGAQLASRAVAVFRFGKDGQCCPKYSPGRLCYAYLYGHTACFVYCGAAACVFGVVLLLEKRQADPAVFHHVFTYGHPPGCGACQ